MVIKVSSEVQFRVGFTLRLQLLSVAVVEQLQFDVDRVGVGRSHPFDIARVELTVGKVGDLAPSQRVLTLEDLDLLQALGRD